MNHIPIKLLTVREIEVLRQLATGKSNDEIATALVLSVKTLENHLHNIYSGLGGTSRSEIQGQVLGLPLENPALSMF